MILAELWVGEGRCASKSQHAHFHHGRSGGWRPRHWPTAFRCTAQPQLLVALLHVSAVTDSCSTSSKPYGTILFCPCGDARAYI